MEQLTHLSLFSGIGGLDLAAEWAGIKTIGQCEFADYPTRVLERHWPNVARWRDIITLTGDSFYEQTGRETVDIISGGFPCQPHSIIGSRKAEKDERHLWPEYMRVVSELRPRWVIGENVNGILSTIHESVCTDLEKEGYEVRTFCVPAYAVGAHHERYRVFIVGISQSESGFQANKTINSNRAKREAWSDPCVEPWDSLPGTYWSVHQPPVCGMGDGIPEWMGGYKCHKERMTCYGNAVVPQQAYPIFKAIAEVEQYLLN
ncbi:MAG: DNA cytosine methyltransferase [Lachnospiraceae bacterium]